MLGHVYNFNQGWRNIIKSQAILEHVSPSIKGLQCMICL